MVLTYFNGNLTIYDASIRLQPPECVHAALRGTLLAIQCLNIVDALPNRIAIDIRYGVSQCGFLHHFSRIMLLSGVSMNQRCERGNCRKH